MPLLARFGSVHEARSKQQGRRFPPRRFGEKEGSVYVRTIKVAPGIRVDHFTITPASVAAARATRPLD